MIGHEQGSGPGGSQPLLRPGRLGDLELPNRVMMAPLTRARAGGAGLVPTDLHAAYYAQRATAGLIITEGAWVSERAIGFPGVPGIYSASQVTAWRAEQRLHGPEVVQDALALGGILAERVGDPRREAVRQHPGRQAQQDDGVEPVIELPLVRGTPGDEEPASAVPGQQGSHPVLAPELFRSRTVRCGTLLGPSRLGGVDHLVTAAGELGEDRGLPGP